MKTVIAKNGIYSFFVFICRKTNECVDEKSFTIMENYGNISLMKIAIFDY